VVTVHAIARRAHWLRSTKNQYVRGANTLLQVAGKTPEAFGVDIEEAKRGVVKRKPDMIPAMVRNR
jgi:hypothetical protein